MRNGPRVGEADGGARSGQCAGSLSFQCAASGRREHFSSCSLNLLAGKFITSRYICEWRRPVKMIAEYLERALQFELLAAAETNPKLKADLQKQATAYRKLAAERTKQLETEAALLRRL